MLLFISIAFMFIILTSVLQSIPLKHLPLQALLFLKVYRLFIYLFLQYSIIPKKSSILNFRTCLLIVTCLIVKFCILRGIRSIWLLDLILYCKMICQRVVFIVFFSNTLIKIYLAIKIQNIYPFAFLATYVDV